MGQFEYETALSKLMTPEVVSALGDIRELKGRTASLAKGNPEAFDALTEVAKIQSTSASNRIENISTSERRLRELMLQNATPRNRDEREIAGYRYVLDMIHESHDDIPLSSNVILQLHRDLYRFTGDSFAGRWKDSDNFIAERTVDGEMVARFIPTSAAGTPAAVERICAEYQRQITANKYDPLLVSLLFAFDFVSIHPFNDGNGRMSRLLTLLLMYRSGYDVGKYVSIEGEIERSKETYYEALAASSAGWQNGENDYEPFISYMLGVVTACYKELDTRFGVIATPVSNEKSVRAFFDRLIGTATKREIMDANPGMSQRTLERILSKLQREGTIEKVGAARATSYKSAESTGIDSPSNAIPSTSVPWRVWRLGEHPEMTEEAAAWFSAKWGIPEEAYRDSMRESARADGAVPQWYVVRADNEPAGAIIAGCGIIENDFHDRPDLAPNLCALYVEEEHRHRGLARYLLDYARATTAAMGRKRLYLVTDLVGFYEKCGWDYLGDAHEPDGNAIRLYGADTLSQG